MPTFVTDEVVSATKLNNATARDWTTWTPTLTNLNVGTTGVVVARYCQIGSEAVILTFKATLGGTGISVGSFTFSSPVTLASTYTTQAPVGSASFFDTSAGTTFVGILRWDSTTTLRPLNATVSGTTLTHNNVNSTTPFTWATGDIIQAGGVLEIA